MPFRSFLRAAFLAIALLLLENLFAFAQQLNDAQVDSLVKIDLKKFDVPGIAVGIIKDGKLIYRKGFGVSSLQTQQPVNAQTLFGIASNTKAFTAAALGVLVDDGKLNWDDKVTKYLPEFRLYDAWATKEMTIRDLLVHRSGLATGLGDLMHDPDSTDFTVKDIIYNLRYLKPSYSFRSKFAYDNNLYLVAGEIIARISKMTWEEFVTKRILQPLEMNSSAASYQACRQSKNIIAAHKKINDTVRVVTRYASTKDDAAGGIYTNIDDLSKWLLMLLNAGKYGEGLNKHLLSERVVQDLWSPQMLIPVGNGGVEHTHFAAYGLGWFMTDVKGFKKIFHSGQDVGMIFEVTMIPELQLGIIVLTNSETNVIDAITDQITDSYLSIKGTNRSEEAFTRLTRFELANKQLKAKVWEQAKTQQAKLPVLKKAFTGIYHDPWFGNINISIRKNQFWFAAEKSAQLKEFLFPYQNHTYVVKWQNPEIDADAYVVFQPGAKGKATTVTLKSVVPSAGYNFDGLLFTKIKSF